MYESEREALAVLAAEAQSALPGMADTLVGHIDEFNAAIARYAAAWSGSNLAGHSTMYYEGITAPPSDRRWNSVVGMTMGGQPGWISLNYPAVVQAIEAEAGRTLDEAANEIDALLNRMNDLRDRFVEAAARISKAARLETGLEDRLVAVEAVKLTVPSLETQARKILPKSHITSDLTAGLQPTRLAPHQAFSIVRSNATTVANRARELARSMQLAAAAAAVPVAGPTGGVQLDPVSESVPSAQPVTPFVPEGGDGPRRPAREQVLLVAACEVFFLLLAAAAIWARNRCLAWGGKDPAPFGAAVALAVLSSAVAVVALVLAGSVLWYGGVKRRADFSAVTLDVPLRWAAGFAAGAAVLTLMGIG